MNLDFKNFEHLSHICPQIIDLNIFNPSLFGLRSVEHHENKLFIQVQINLSTWNLKKSCVPDF